MSRHGCSLYFQTAERAELNLQARIEFALRKDFVLIIPVLGGRTCAETRFIKRYATSLSSSRTGKREENGYFK